MIIVHNLSLESFRQTFEARASEWMLTGAVLSLAAVFLFNREMFYGEAFEGLRSINSNQNFWTAAFAIVGMVRLSVLLVNGHYYRTPHGRAVTAFLSGGVWFMLCVGFARNGSVLIALSPWIFFLDMYNTVRAAKEAGKSEFNHRYSKRQGSLTNGIGTHS